MRIYLDHNATTPLRASVIERMTEVLRGVHGNPSSVYEEGAAAREAIESARAEVASLLGASPGEIRLTGGATESNNTALFGVLRPGDHVVTSAVEHPSVAAPLAALAGRGVRVTRVQPEADGCMRAESMIAALEAETRLVSLIWANNETGAIQPVEAVAAACRARGILFHVDATQAVGKLDVDLGRVPADLLACSAHKIGGPKGAGALFVRRGVELPALLLGGGQEKGFRGGTENVAGWAGFGAACAEVRRTGPAERELWRKLRDRLWTGLEGLGRPVRWNGDRDRTLPNTLNVEFEGADGEALVQALDLDGVAVSAGAACHSGSVEPSGVLLAMGRSVEQARSSLRLSVGAGTDEEQIDRVVGLLAELVPRAQGRAR